MNEEQITALIAEGTAFVKMRADERYKPNPAAGTAGNLLSTKWLQKYKEFICYDVLKRNLTPSNERFSQDKHPGPISNTDFVETDQ